MQKFWYSISQTKGYTVQLILVKNEPVQNGKIKVCLIMKFLLCVTPFCPQKKRSMPLSHIVYKIQVIYIKSNHQTLCFMEINSSIVGQIIFNCN